MPPRDTNEDCQRLCPAALSSGRVRRPGRRLRWHTRSCRSTSDRECELSATARSVSAVDGGRSREDAYPDPCSQGFAVDLSANWISAVGCGRRAAGIGVRTRSVVFPCVAATVCGGCADWGTADRHPAGCSPSSGRRSQTAESGRGRYRDRSARAVGIRSRDPSYPPTADQPAPERAAQRARTRAPAVHGLAARSDSSGTTTLSLYADWTLGTLCGMHTAQYG